MKESKNKDLTQGSIVKGIILFALPLLGTSLIQQMYNTIDLMFVGHIIGKNASAAVGTCGWPINVLVGFFSGMGVGVGVLTAQHAGAKDHKGLKKIIHTAMGIVIAGAMCLMIIGCLAAPYVLAMMNTPEEIIGLSVTYARIYFLSMFSIIGFNFSAGILRALGNSRDPMIYQFLGGLANIGGNFIFIYLLDMGVAGAALATFCSQTCAALLTIRHLRKLPEEYRLHIRQINLDFSIMKKIFVIGVPMGLQSTLISVSLLMLQASINTLGVVSMAAYTAYAKAESLVYYPMWAMGQASTTFSAQNLGSGQMDRAQKGTRTALMISIGIIIIITLTLSANAKWVMRLFTNEADVINLGSKIIVRLFPLYFIYCFVEVLSGAMRGAGKTSQVMVLSLINMFGVRLAFLYIAMHLFDTVYEICLIFPATWITTATCIILYYLSGKWKKGWIETESKEEMA